MIACKPKTDITEKAPTVLEMSYAVGSLLGPIIGGGLNDLGGFTFATTVIAYLTLLFSFVFFLVIFAADWCKKKEVSK